MNREFAETPATHRQWKDSTKTCEQLKGGKGGNAVHAFS